MQALGINIGHSHTKAVVLNERGEMHTMSPFPSQIAPATTAQHSIAQSDMVTIDRRPYWYGTDAEMGNATSLYDQARLTDPTFLPALAKATMHQLGINESLVAYTCLPATWTAKAKLLNDRIREGAETIVKLGVITEPEAAAYSALLDNAGNVTGDARLRGRVGVVDIGGGTVDVAVLHNLQVEPNSPRTNRRGLVHALTSVQSMIASEYDREISLYQTDMAVRQRKVVVAGQDRDLPDGWERSFTVLAGDIVTFLDSLWGSGNHLDSILIAGGGACETLITDALERKYPHAIILEDAQQAMAIGCARRARMLVQQMAQRGAA
jgi:hypothetical protein